MFDHITIGVSDLERAMVFYDKALQCLNVSRLVSVTAALTGSNPCAGYGENNNPFFWIEARLSMTGITHVAFLALDRATVRAFHEDALHAGGRDNGPPGLRTQYHPNYYAAFVFDPDGHNIEAVCHKPE